MELDDSEKFDGISELVREGDVLCTDTLDSFHIDLVAGDPATVAQRSEDDGLVGGIPTVHIESRIGLGVPEFLCFLESLFISKVGLRHPGEDVVAGTVDDSDHGLNVITDQRFLDGLDDGDPAGHDRFVVDGTTMFFRDGEKFLTSLGEKSLIPGDDCLAVLQCRLHKGKGTIDPADQFNDHVDLGIENEIVDQASGRQVCRGRGAGKLGSRLPGSWVAPIDLLSSQSD